MADDTLLQTPHIEAPPEAYEKDQPIGASVGDTRDEQGNLVSSNAGTPTNFPRRLGPDDIMHVQLSDQRVASLPTSSFDALRQQDPGAKPLGFPKQGKILVQLSDQRTATLPVTSLEALRQQDPNFKIIARGTGVTLNMPEQPLTSMERAEAATGQFGSDVFNATAGMNAYGEPAKPGENWTKDVSQGVVNAIPGVGTKLANVIGDSTPEQRAKADPFGNMFGFGLEQTAEYMAGMKALEGLFGVARFRKLIPFMKTLEEWAVSNPKLAATMAATAKNAVVGGTQGLAHGESLGQAATTGAIAGGVGGVTEASIQGIKALRPTAQIINGVAVPVRSSVANPTWVNKLAEFVADRPALQKFDATRTQQAAQGVIDSLASETAAKPALAEAKTILKTGAFQDALSAMNDYQIAGRELSKLHGTPGFTPEAWDSATSKMMAAAEKIKNLDSAAIEDHFNKVIDAFQGDFGAASKTLREELSPLYERSEGYSKLKNARDAAFRRGDDVAEQTAKDQLKTAFEKASGVGTYDKINGLYSRLDAIDAIGKKLRGSTVIKNTPSDFLDTVLAKAKSTGNPNPVDPGIIDGAGLRKAIRELSESTPEYRNGVFKAARIPDDTVSKLQELGSLLERSKVQERSKIGFGRYSSATAGVAGGAASVGLELALSHALTASTGGLAAAGAAAGYGANKFLGRLMTDPAFWEYTLRAARALAPPLAVQATHAFDPQTGSLTVINP